MIENISLDSYQNKEKYKIIKILLKGEFEEVYEVINIDDNRHYIIQKINTKDITKEELDIIKNESKLLSNLDNKYLVKYYESFNSEDSFNIVMEYCKSLSLRKFMQNQNGKLFDKNIVYNFILDICLGLKEIHSNNIIHRDLKPENIFLENLQLKIGHFGISKQIKNINENTKTQLGILSYMAPEIIKGDYYNKKADIWSLGCIIYELCTLGYCFKNNSIIELRNDINNPKPRKIDTNIYGIWLQNLIDRILIKDGDKRLNIDEILRIVYNHINPLDYNKKLFLFSKNEAYQDFLIEQSILDSLDQIEINIYHRENKWAEIKEAIFEFTYLGYLL
jgi:NIMA (never in mitosis gene a)-related kinase